MQRLKQDALKKIPEWPIYTSNECTEKCRKEKCRKEKCRKQNVESKNVEK